MTLRRSPHPTHIVERAHLTPSLPKQRESGAAGGPGLTESMLALLVNSLGFTPGLRPAPSARSSIESPVAMRIDLEGVSLEMVEVAEALESVVSELQDINTIQKQNIQKLVSCPDPAPPSAPATRPLRAVSSQLSPKLWHLQDEISTRFKDSTEDINARIKSMERSLLELLNTRNQS